MAIQMRFLIIALLVFAATVELMTRVSLNLAIVSMVLPPGQANHSNAIEYDVCPVPDDFRTNFSSVDSPRVSKMSTPRFDWSPKTQGVLLGAFFYSYVVLQIPLARLAELIGGKWIIAVGVLGSGLVNLLTPLMASSVTLLIVSRVALGVLQCGIYPAGYGLLYKWFPQKERSLAFGLLDSGTALGNIVATLLTGYLSEHGFAGGWPSAFYVTGIIACVASLIFALFVTSSPEQSRFVSESELDYINQGRALLIKTPKIPWTAILTSKQVLSYVFAKFCHLWTFITIQSKLPTFMSDILHIPPTANGALNALLYVAACTTLCTCGPASELVIRKGWLRRTNTRKLFGAIAYIGTSCCVLMVPVVGCNANAITGFLVLSQVFLGMISGGDLPMAAEMSANFPATIYSLTNMVSMSAGFIVPFVAGVILESGANTIFCWNAIFTLAGCITLFGALAFILFAEAEIQPWDQPVVVKDEHCCQSISVDLKSSPGNQGQEMLNNNK